MSVIIISEILHVPYELEYIYPAINERIAVLKEFFIVMLLIVAVEEPNSTFPIKPELYELVQTAFSITKFLIMELAFIVLKIPE